MSIEVTVCAATGARAAHRVERLQSLWSGWGEIARYALDGAEVPTVIVKRVQPPTADRHPRGWTSDRSSERKRRSYEVELAFYQRIAPTLPPSVRLARAWHLEPGLFVLEDLDASGFSGRADYGAPLDEGRIAACVDWLAGLHGACLDQPVDGLWPIGTYWHLDTRPDEWAAMAEGPLKRQAAALDSALNAVSHRTVVHGDAKVANFCFGPSGVAAVDFQYAGGGCGLKDLAYFLGSCLGDRGLEQQADRWLQHYFTALARAVPATVSVDALEADWRPLWPHAWADFERFLAGWAPAHRKRTGFAAALTRSALDRL